MPPAVGVLDFSPPIRPVGCRAYRAARLGIFLLALTAATRLWAQPPVPLAGAWLPDGQVNAVATSSTTAYLGGSFTQLGPYVGGGINVNTTTGSLAPPYPQVNGNVYTVLADGSGGWFIGGAFTQVGGQSISYLAHILSTGAVDPSWNANVGPAGDPNAAVYALALVGSTLYVGGDFTSVQGQTRNYLAAVDTTTIIPTSWDPEADGSVVSLVVHGTVIFVGGYFSNLNTTTTPVARTSLAALSTTTGIPTAWNPNLSGGLSGGSTFISALALTGSTLYAGGNFTSGGGATQNCLVALDTTSATASSWNPNPDDWVYTLTVNGSTIYAGGYFSNIGGAAHNRIAALNNTTGAAGTWNPAIQYNRTGYNPFVRSILVSGSTVYIGGRYDTVGGQTFHNVVAVDATSAAPSSWNPATNNDVWTLGLNASGLYIGGVFNSVNGTARSNLAAVDLTTGNLTTWNPGADNTVQTLVVNAAGTEVYAGGTFANIGGAARNHLAALDGTTGTAITAWNPNPQSGNPATNIYTIALAGSTVYIGGNFGTIGGQSVHALAAVDATSGNASSWNPQLVRSGIFSPYVTSVLVVGTTVYAGGAFTSAGGATRGGLAAFNGTTAAVLSWNPNASTTLTGASLAIHSMVSNGSAIYVGGNFTSIGSRSPLNFVAALDLNTGAASTWNPTMGENTSDTIDSGDYALALNGSTLYIGGLFSTVGGQSLTNLVAVDTGTAAPLSWTPNPNGLVFGLSINGTTLAAGGSFPVISQTNRSDFDLFTITAAQAAPQITASTASATVGVAFAYQIVATNSPTSYSAAGLPASGSLTLNTATGLITGTPGIADGGTYSVFLTATNGAGPGPTVILALTINGPPVITASTAAATVGVAFSYKIQATNSPSSYSSTGLPSSGDLTLNTVTGLISGIPASADVGTYTVTLTATNSFGTSAPATLTLTINSAPAGVPVITASTAAATVGVAFSYQIQATNNPTSYNATGLPPSGTLSLNTVSGLVSGTPALADVGAYTVTLSATNGTGTGMATLTLTITGNGQASPTGSSFAPRVHPNPWRSTIDAGYAVTFDQLTGNSTIKIFDVAGHWVKTVTTSSVSVDWDRTNDSGVAVASGLYFYVATNDQGQEVRGKLVIIK